MTKFQVLSSILTPSDLGQFVIEKYSLTNDTTCKLLKAGINHTYRIDSKDETFIFRVYSYHWRSKDEIIEELRLLTLLKQNNISISFPFADKTGEYIQTVDAPEGERYAVLFSYAEGHKIQNYSNELHFKIGELMAQIHVLTNDLKQNRTTYNSDILLNDSLHNIKKFLTSDSEEMLLLIEMKKILEAEIANADTNFIRKGIVHLDIWFDNLNISDSNEITLFDFDFCGNGWLCLDIAYYIMQVHNTEKIQTDKVQKIDSFLKGYEATHKISEEEKRLIPILGVCLYYFYLGIQCKRFDNWSNTFMNEVYLKRYIAVFIKGYYETTKSK